MSFKSIQRIKKREEAQPAAAQRREKKPRG
jgi:hypothetical protein